MTWPIILGLLLAGDRAIAAPDARAAVQRALPFLEGDGVAWMAGKLPKQKGGGGCVSCHHVGFALWSQREAARAGFPIPAERIDALEKDAHAYFTANPDEARAITSTELLVGGSGAKIDLDQLLGAQRADGRFEASGQYPTQDRPLVESDAVATLWALVAMGKDGAPAARKKAADWLKAAARGETTEWLAVRALALGEGEDLRRLVGEQHADGGWGWRAAGPSNAYSTGQALYTLAIAVPRDPAVGRAVTYLVGTQAAGGTWATPSELISKKSQPKRDYIYEYWGTAWAVIGLARTLERVSAPSR